MTTASQVSITGYTIIPSGERVARPTRRRVRPSPLERARRHLRLRWDRRRERHGLARVDAASAPQVRDPREVMIVRHAAGEIRRI